MIDQTLKLEEWHSITRQIATLTERKKAIEVEFADQFSTKDGALSTIHNVGHFALTKKEGFKYTLNKKAYNKLTPEQQNAMLELGVVQNDIKMSEAKVRTNAREHSVLLSACFEEKPVNEIKIEYKPKEAK